MLSSSLIVISEQTKKEIITSLGRIEPINDKIFSRLEQEAERSHGIELEKTLSLTGAP